MFTVIIEWGEQPYSSYSVKVQGEDRRRTVEAAQAAWDALDAVGFRMFSNRPEMG